MGYFHQCLTKDGLRREQIPHAAGLFQAHLEKGISRPHIWTNRAAQRPVKAPGRQGPVSQGLRSVGQLVYKASLVHWGQALRAKVHKKHSLCFLGRIKRLSGYWVSLVHVTASQSDPSSGTICQRLTQQHSASGPSVLSPSPTFPRLLVNSTLSHDLPLPLHFPGESHLTVCLAPRPSISPLGFIKVHFPDEDAEPQGAKVACPAHTAAQEQSIMGTYLLAPNSALFFFLSLTSCLSD